MRWTALVAILSICSCGTPSGAVSGAAPAIIPKVVAGARAQLANPASYDASYKRIAYPGGDVALDRGACTDVVIRAYRFVGKDLQKLVHEDAKRVPSAYPRIKQLDTNIDHRRVPNLTAFFARHGLTLSRSSKWTPGDIVTWKLPGNLDHIGVVTDQKGPSGNWMVIHNMSRTVEEDVLTAWPITGHYRYGG